MGLEFRREFRQTSYGGVWPAATPERRQAGRPRKRSCHEANSKSAAPSARFCQIRRLANFETLPTENVQHPGNSGRPQGCPSPNDHTGQADMIQAAEQSLAALLNGAVALRGMRREPSRCAANVMDFIRSENRSTRKFTGTT